jgi:putative membrane protein
MENRDATRRTRLANERTFLAWWRTALGACGLAIGVGKLVPEVVPGPHWPYVALGAFFAILGALVAGIGWWRHAAVDHSLTGGEEARIPDALVAMLAGGLLVSAALLAVLVLLG